MEKMEEESLSTLCQLIQAQLTLLGQGETGEQDGLLVRGNRQELNTGIHRTEGTQHKDNLCKGQSIKDKFGEKDIHCEQNTRIKELNEI